MFCNLSIKKTVDPKLVLEYLDFSLRKNWGLPFCFLDYIKRCHSVNSDIILFGSVAEHLIDYFCFGNSAKTNFPNTCDLDFVCFKESKIIINPVFLFEHSVSYIKAHNNPPAFFVSNNILQYNIISSIRECIINLDTGEIFYSKKFAESLFNKVIYPPEFFEKNNENIFSDHIIYFIQKIKLGYSIDQSTYPYIAYLIENFVNKTSIEFFLKYFKITSTSEKYKINNEEFLSFLKEISDSTNTTICPDFCAEKINNNKATCFTGKENIAYYSMYYDKYLNSQKYNIEIIGEKLFLEWFDNLSKVWRTT